MGYFLCVNILLWTAVFLPESLLSLLLLVEGKQEVICGFLNSITRLSFISCRPLSERPSSKSPDLSLQCEELSVSNDTGVKCSTTLVTFGLAELSVVYSSMFCDYSDFSISYLSIFWSFAYEGFSPNRQDCTNVRKGTNHFAVEPQIYSGNSTSFMRLTS